ncbi:MAG: hypothetical protein ChlgKO_12360 [Chlamydiales bacterium]
MKKIFLLSFFSINMIWARDVDKLLHAKEWREKQLYLAKINASKAQQFEHDLYHPSPERKIVLDLFTFDGSKKSKMGLKFSQNKMTLGTDRAVSLMEKMRFKNHFEKGDWRRYADLAIDDLKRLQVTTFQRLGEALYQTLNEAETL